MKSSTIRRSTLSKESMEVIENLSKEQEDSSLPGEYVRPDEVAESENNNGMSQEIDLLWQNFKTTQFNTNSPVINLLAGIVIGVILTLAGFAIHSMIVKNTSVQSAKTAGWGVEKASVDSQKTSEQTIEQQLDIQQEASSETAKAPALDVSGGQTAPEEADGAAEVAQDTSNMTKYKVKSGDTIESIIKNHYGAYSPDKAEQIMQVNNMKSLDRINIDQELLLP